MVTQATSLSRNGVSDWIIQRVTAYILAAYTVVLTGYVLVQEQLTFEVGVASLTRPGCRSSLC